MYDNATFDFAQQIKIDLVDIAVSKFRYMPGKGEKNAMYGAIIGDIIGSAYESTGIKTKRFLLFPINTSITDYSIMTVAVAQALMKWDKEKEELNDAMI